MLKLKVSAYSLIIIEEGTPFWTVAGKAVTVSFPPSDTRTRKQIYHLTRTSWGTVDMDVTKFHHAKPGLASAGA